MWRFSIGLAIILFVSLGIAGCGGDDMENLWVDTQGDGYPGANDMEFGSMFIKENKKRLDELASMMLSYDFDYDIDCLEDDVCVTVWERDANQKERDELSREIQSDEKLMLYITALFEFEYIDSIGKSDADGKSVGVDFVDINDPIGPIYRIARYIPDEVLNDHPRKEEYLQEYHVVGNWFYMESMRV